MLSFSRAGNLDQMRRPSIPFLILLFAVFAVLTIAAANADITDTEARLLWIVRDPERVEPAAIGDTARLLARNFRAMLDRAGTGDLPLAVPLDLWTTLTGGSIFAARLSLVLLFCTGIAVLYTLLRRSRLSLRYVATLVLGVASLYACGFLNNRLFVVPVMPVIEEFLVERRAAEPVITNFRDDSPLGYYQAQYDLRRGLAINLGWRDFTDEEITGVVENLGSGPIWLLLGNWNDDPYLSMLKSRGRMLTWCEAAHNVLIMRFEVSDGPSVQCPFFSE
jgi:hypothetical protein